VKECPGALDNISLFENKRPIYEKPWPAYSIPIPSTYNIVVCRVDHGLNDCLLVIGWDNNKVCNSISCCIACDFAFNLRF